MKLIKIPNTLFFILILFIVSVVVVGESPFIKDRLGGIAQNVRFKTITKNMYMEKFDNITFYYSNKKDETFITYIKKYIREGEVKTTTLLGQTNIYPLNLVLFTTPEEFGKVFKVNPEESLAVTIFNTMYIQYDNISPYVFVHEYTHYKINSFCKENRVSISNLPIWFQEGVAEYTSSTLFPNKFKNPKIQTIQDFKKLDKLKQILASEDNGQNSYMQSYIAVKKIIELKGQESIKKILINTKSMTFYNSFEKVVGLSIEDFQKLLE
ncbi:peptidase MA family metallohydrolase [Clostridium sp.]